MTIDWEKPIEAVHVDGRVEAANLMEDLEYDSTEHYLEKGIGDRGLTVFKEDGTSWADGDYEWTIRNRVAASGDSDNEELTELRAFKEEALASGYVPAELVDPDLLEAREIAASAYEASFGAGSSVISKTRNGECDNDWDVKSALSGIKRGRELERQRIDGERK